MPRGSMEVPVTLEDRTRWNDRYRALAAQPAPAGPPGDAVRHVLVAAAPYLPGSGRVLELACGAGRESVWLAQRGLHVVGIDIAEQALQLAAERAARHGVTHRVSWVAADLDDGLPAGSEGPYDVIVACHFRSALLEAVVAGHLEDGGVVVASRLSVVGRGEEPGPDPAFLAQPGELASLARRLGLHIRHDEEADGAAALVAQRI